MAAYGRYIFTNLIEAVETLSRNNASLTMQLKNTTKINLEMAKKLNFKATQAQEPEDKRLKEISSKKSNFERNLDPDGYCWMQEFRVTKRHRSQTFSSPATGPQRAASHKYHGKN